MPEEAEPIPATSLVPVTPMVLLERALATGVDVEKLTKLFDLQERWEKQQAAVAFNEAIRKFQSLCPPIVKANKVHGKDRSDGTKGPVHYCFANYDDIMEVAQPILAECGISVTFSTKINGQLMETTCRVRVGTHSEETSVTLALPVIPNANDAQRAGGALSYGQRYSLKAALNIRITGEDDDAVSQDGGTIEEAQVKVLEGLLNDYAALADKPINQEKFLKWLGPDLTKLADIPKASFTKAVSELSRKVEGVAK